MTSTTRREPRLFRYGGRTLAEWLPDVVARVAERFEPERIVLFGSLARGEAGFDSDIDLLVEFDRAMDKHATAVALRGAIEDIPAPVDFLVTDAEEIRRRGTVPGLALSAAIREGTVVYERP
jgi:predicted nucleotidyltransferase